MGETFGRGDSGEAAKENEEICSTVLTRQMEKWYKDYVAHVVLLNWRKT